MMTTQSVAFHGDQLIGFEDERGVFVALKPIAEALNLNWSAQLQRVKRDPILAEGMVVMVRPTPGGPQDMVCLRLELLNGWLFTIDEGRAKNPETRDKVLTYRRECFRTLYERFRSPSDAPALASPAAVDIALGTACNLVTEARRSYGKQAARELWPQLGLPMTPAMRTVLAASTAPSSPPAQGSLFGREA